MTISDTLAAWWRSARAGDKRTARWDHATIGGVMASKGGIVRNPLAEPSAIAVAATCMAEILCLAGYSSVPALLPQFIDDLSLSNSQAGWLAGMLSAGYMLGVLPLVSLTDRVPARVIYLASALASALSSLGVAFSYDLLTALGWRAIGGVALAGMYMPGLRALTDAVQGARRARIAALYTSSFTFGASLSFLIGQVGIAWGWRSTFILAGVLGIIGVLLAWLALPHSEPAPPEQRPPMLDVRAVFGKRDAIVLMLGYAATIWGSSGFRQWIVVFLAFCASGKGPMAWSTLAIGMFIGVLGVPAGLLGNELSLRFGLRRTAAIVFLISGLTNCIFGIVGNLPYGAVVVLSLIAGFVVQGNFSNLTSGILAVAARGHRGATVAVYSCIGFGGGFLGTLMFGVALDRFGGTTTQAAWAAAFGTCGLACLCGSVVTSFLSRTIWPQVTVARQQ